MNNKKIWDYFKDNIEYPKEVAHNTLPYNVVWTYISSTFLNGLINYVKPIKCFLIDRYTPDDIILEDVRLWCEDTKKKFEGTKGELKQNVISGNIKEYHTELKCFDDDIIILAKIETNNNETGKYMFFWFDMDVSDCSIGKIDTTDSEEDVIQSVINWLEYEKSNNNNQSVEEDSDSGIVNYTEIPILFLNGWIKF